MPWTSAEIASIVMAVASIIVSIFNVILTLRNRQ